MKEGNGKFLFTIITLICTLLLLAGSVFAWFAVYGKIQADINLAVDASGANVSINMYKKSADGTKKDIKEDEAGNLVPGDTIGFVVEAQKETSGVLKSFTMRFSGISAPVFTYAGTSYDMLSMFSAKLIAAERYDESDSDYKQITVDSDPSIFVQEQVFQNLSQSQGLRTCIFANGYSMGYDKMRFTVEVYFNDGDIPIDALQSSQGKSLSIKTMYVGVV